ncbi:hypothetical protein [Metallosphaera hakonensis]|uniref:hypothetical protein n=1 Tax=Metallosphaera hakonensis TaxID=79601 RepID=UPI0020930C4F|nr:hypothetical protein [Metallosphaera hakonensis]
MGSAVSLALGGALLLNLVPSFLTVSTYMVTLVLISLAYLIERGVTWAINVGVILGILAILASTLSGAHIVALEEFGTNPRITSLDVLMLLGFYVFPGSYVILWTKEALTRRKLRERKSPSVEGG